MIEIASKTKQKEIVEHLLSVGWLPNIGYIETMKRKKTFLNKLRGKEAKKNDDVDFNALIEGRFEEDCHLTSPCEKYTVRITPFIVSFWRRNPTWLQLMEVNHEELVLTEKGVRCEIIKLELEE